MIYLSWFFVKVEWQSIHLWNCYILVLKLAVLDTLRRIPIRPINEAKLKITKTTKFDSHRAFKRDFFRRIKSSSCPCTYVATKYSFPLIKPLLWEWAWQPRKLAVANKFVQSSESKPNSSNKNRLAHKQIIQKFRAIDSFARTADSCPRNDREMTWDWPQYTVTY